MSNHPFATPAFQQQINRRTFLGRSGLGLLEAVREHDLDVPVILLTGLPKLDSAIRAVEHGAFRYLAKPIDRAALSRTLERCIAHV